MAKRKMKKYAEGKLVYEDDVDTSDEMYSDYGSKKGFGAAGTANETRIRAADAPRPADAIDLPPLPAMSKSMEDAPKAKPKANIVTKEELAKSGLSLRDYMNKQQGLTRRGDSAPAVSRVSAPTASRVSATAPDTGDNAARLLNSYKKPPLRQETMRERAESYNRKRGIPGYKKGGSVSSASKRADGIAIRGKTRI